MYSSGTIATTTASSANVTLIPMPGGGASYNRLIITNAGTADGFFSTDGGNTWGYIPGTPAGTAVVPVEWIGSRTQTSPLIKRNTATNMSGVFAFAESVDYK